MKRREFILITSAGVVAVVIPTLYYSLRSKEYDVLLAQPQSLAHIWDTDTIHAMGTKYISLVPRENSERVLVKRLLAGIADEGTNLASTMEHRIKKDFESDNTIMLDGWILSVTEARQCALFSIHQPKL